MFLLVCAAEGVLFAISRFRPDLTLSPFEWVLLALAVSILGPAVAYMTVGEWLRFPVAKVVNHSCGVGQDTEPKFSSDGDEPWYCGPLHALGELVTCPICASVWMGLLLLSIYAVNGELGRITIYVFAATGISRILIRLAELLEWEKNLAWEKTGYWNRRNKHEAKYGYCRDEWPTNIPQGSPARQDRRR